MAVSDRATHCVSCNKRLSGLQRLYCSRRCKARVSGNSYPHQKLRGELRKNKLIALKGGKCQHCGYCKNTAALSFHHRDPSLKKFGLDSRSISNRSWGRVLAESRKCDLLCLNCHAELHHPDN